MKRRIGIRHVHLESVDSTNTMAKSLILEGTPHGTAVTAGVQTKGRGRHERVWESEKDKNLLVSYVLFPERDQAEWGALSLLSGIAVVDAIEDRSSCRAHLKWPNDVLIKDRKTAGILIETGSEHNRPWAVIGIGINVNQTVFPEALRSSATSLSLATRKTHDVMKLLTSLSAKLESWYAHWLVRGNHAIMSAWKERTRMLGRMIHITEHEAFTECRAVDLNDDGSLVVAAQDGSLASIHAADISVRYSPDTAADV
jgi:BirA family biotin operon repressor/biotin-[acetyl-CoA-carboxylase] ligase